jgi:CHAT domain-containing protein/Tfp pilus assembly protein PilF
MIRPHSRSTYGTYRLWIFCCGLALSVSLPFIQIQASPDQLCATVVTQAQENQHPQQLEPGKPLERELAGGQSHSYQIAPGAGQYVKLAVEQRGIDVEVKLFGPDGKQNTQFDSEAGLREKETVEWVAEEAGSYRVDVLAKQKEAAAGQYEIKVVGLRLATVNDGALIESRKLNAGFLKLYRAGKYDEAIPLAKRMVEIRESILGPDHLGVAHALSNLAILYFSKNDYAKTEPLYQRVLAIRKKALGPEHPDIATDLYNLALLYKARSDYTTAEPLYQRALTIREKALGPEHPAVADVLDSLANLCSDRGDYTEADQLYQRALTIRQKVFGPEDLSVARGLHNHAELYRKRGNYPRAEQLLQRSLAISEKVLGREHPEIADSLNSLAGSYYDRGDYAKAKEFHQRALIIREKALGPEHPKIAQSLNNLANIYNFIGDYAKTELILQRSLTINVKALGPENPEVAISLNNLAEHYRGRGYYARAEQLYKRALAIREKRLETEHPNFAASLNSLAVLYRKRGDHANAEQLYRRTLTILENALGPEHPYIAGVLNEIAMLYAAMGNIAQAFTFLSRAYPVDERSLALNLAAGSERQKLAYLDLFSKRTDFTLSLQSQAVPNDPQALDLAFTTLLRRKGRGLDAMTDTIATFRRHATPQDQKLFDKLADARSQLAALTLKEPDAAKPDTYRKRTEELAAEVDKLEADISSRSAGFLAQTQPVTLNTIQAALPSGTALVEFAYFTPLDPKTEKSKPPRYLAYLLPTQGQPKWVDLGEAAMIDRAIVAWRKALRNPNRTDVKRLARAVDEKLMQPVRSLLREIPGDTRRLLIAPDGSLNFVPFAALVDEQNQYLVERYSIVYLTSGRDLLRLQTPQLSNGLPLVVANPDFGRLATIAMREGQNSGRSRTRSQSLSRIDARQIFFQPLPATEDEALAIQVLLPKATVLRQAEATEAALKQASRPQILHIATHGFFLNYQGPLTTEGDQLHIASPGTPGLASVQTMTYTVQLEATPALATAQETVKRLRAQGMDAYIVKSRVKGKGTFFRVRAGNFLTQTEAKKYGVDMLEKGIADEFFVARYEPPQADLMEPSPTTSGLLTPPANSPSATAPPANSQPLTESPSDLRLSKFAAQVKNPLLRSGLALAGANHGKSGDDDGILTAMEAAYLDLSGTKLVVLSACDTGIGDVKNGEGVQGLRRALVLAGSESQVMSLWPVSDEATKDLMIPYYKALQQGEGRSEGLRQVQLRILRGRRDRRHPFYWAAFIQSGEWASLDDPR